MNTVRLNNRQHSVNGKQTISFGYFINKWFTKQAVSFENTRFASMSMLIIVQSCIASVYLLATSAALAMGSNAVFIAQGSAKLCLIIFYLSLLVNILFIFITI